MGVRDARKGVNAAWKVEQEARLAYAAATNALEEKRKELWVAKRDSARRSGRSRSPVGGAAEGPSDRDLSLKVRELEEQLAEMKRIVSSSSSASSRRGRPASPSTASHQRARPASSSTASHQRARPAHSGRR